jgi:hypothetical protein
MTRVNKIMINIDICPSELQLTCPPPPIILYGAGTDMVADGNSAGVVVCLVKSRKNIGEVCSIRREEKRREEKRREEKRREEKRREEKRREEKRREEKSK